MSLNKIPSFNEVKDWVNNNADVPNADYANNAGDADTINGQPPSDFQSLDALPSLNSLRMDDNLSNVHTEANVGSSGSNSWTTVNTFDITIPSNAVAMRLEMDYSYDHITLSSNSAGARITNSTLPNMSFDSGDDSTGGGGGTETRIFWMEGYSAGTYTMTAQVYHEGDGQTTINDFRATRETRASDL